MQADYFTSLNAAAQALGDLRALASWESSTLAAPDEEEELEPAFDADTFTDALCGACFNAQPVEFLKPRERTAADLTDLTTPQVLALLLDEHQPVVTLRAAQEVLVQRCGGVK